VTSVTHGMRSSFPEARHALIWSRATPLEALVWGLYRLAMVKRHLKEWLGTDKVKVVCLPFMSEIEDPLISKLPDPLVLCLNMDGNQSKLTPL
jgi:hypothetical protein